MWFYSYYRNISKVLIVYLEICLSSRCAFSCSVTFTTLDQHPERSWTVHQPVQSRRNWSPWLERSPQSWISNCRWDFFAEDLENRNYFILCQTMPVVYVCGEVLGSFFLWHVSCLTHFASTLQTLLESMMDTAECLCPHVMKRGSLRPELMKASSAKMVVPKSFVTQTLLEQSGVDIINKIRSVSLLRAQWFSLD